MSWRGVLLRAVFIAGIALVGIGPSGCATANEVREIVANSNALMIAPELGDPVSADPGTDDHWKELVQRIDALITANPDQTELVAALRARQAMVLTVYRQDALAREAWKQVDRSDLKTDRDQALHALSEQLIWWFKFGPSSGTIDNRNWDARIGRADDGPVDEGGSLKSVDVKNMATVRAFERVCNLLPAGSDTRLYLEIMRANVVLLVIQDAAVRDANDRARLSTQAVHSVERLASAFDERGQTWLAENLDGPSLPDGAESMSMLRSLSQARSVIQETRAAADAHEPKIVIDTWEPDWLAAKLSPVGGS